MRGMPAQKAVFGLLLIALVCGVLLVCDDTSRFAAEQDAVVREASPTIKQDEKVATKVIKHSLAKVTTWVKKPWKWASDWTPKKAAAGLQDQQLELKKEAKSLQAAKKKAAATRKLEEMAEQAKAAAREKMLDEASQKKQKAEKKQIMHISDKVKAGVKSWVKTPWEWAVDEKKGLPTHASEAGLEKDLNDAEEELKKQKAAEKEAKAWTANVLKGDDGK
jgi:hypothetical protein